MSASTTPAKKLVLLTGATGGIGRATAVAFAKTGEYSLALHYNAAPESTRSQIDASLKDAGLPLPSWRWFQADLGDYSSVRSLHKAVEEEFGQSVDVLFANAGSTRGISGVKSLAEVSIEDAEATWRINTGSVMLLTQLCLPGMEAKGWGRVICNSSVAAFTGGVVGPHYASSKSALHGFIHWLAGNVAKKGITVNGVAPAAIQDTAMLPRNVGSAEIESKIPVGRLGQPDEIAGTVMWMVNTPYLTNKVITVDGGMYAY